MADEEKKNEATKTKKKKTPKKTKSQSSKDVDQVTQGLDKLTLGNKAKIKQKSSTQSEPKKNSEENGKTKTKKTPQPKKNKENIPPSDQLLDPTESKTDRKKKSKKPKPKKNKENIPPSDQQPDPIESKTDGKKTSKKPTPKKQTPIKPRVFSEGQLTPYQGSNKTFGFFRCETCKKTWASPHTWADCFQKCRTCMVAVYPYRQQPLRPGKRKAVKKPHDQSLCQKCQELQTLCAWRSKSPRKQNRRPRKSNPV